MANFAMLPDLPFGLKSAGEPAAAKYPLYIAIT